MFWPDGAGGPRRAIRLLILPDPTHRFMCEDQLCVSAKSGYARPSGRSGYRGACLRTVKLTEAKRLGARHLLLGGESAAVVRNLGDVVNSGSSVISSTMDRRT